MNKFIQAVNDLDVESVTAIVAKDPKWLQWAEKDGKNALHFLGGVAVGDDPAKADASLEILALLLDGGMGINSVHRIGDGPCPFEATPLWYAYTRGRNRRLYTRLLDLGAFPGGCMFAIGWYDDVDAAQLFVKHGAAITDDAGKHTPFVAAFLWRKYAVASWFLENGAEVDTPDEHGHTALYYAVKRKFPDEMIAMLLDFGADPDRPGADGVSPRGYALEKRQRKMLNLLSRSAASP